MVAYNICYYSNGSHGRIGGLASITGRDSVVTTAEGHGMSYLIQHELSHNIGANDHNTLDTCVINGDKGFWCSDCRAKIVAWIQRNS